MTSAGSEPRPCPSAGYSCGVQLGRGRALRGPSVTSLGTVPYAHLKPSLLRSLRGLSLAWTTTGGPSRKAGNHLAHTHSLTLHGNRLSSDRSNSHVWADSHPPRRTCGALQVLSSHRDTSLTGWLCLRLTSICPSRLLTRAVGGVSPCSQGYFSKTSIPLRSASCFKLSTPTVSVACAPGRRLPGTTWRVRTSTQEKPPADPSPCSWSPAGTYSSSLQCHRPGRVCTRPPTTGLHHPASRSSRPNRPCWR